MLKQNGFTDAAVLALYSLELEFCRGKNSVGDVRCVYSETKKAQSLLSHQANFSLKHGLKFLIEQRLVEDQVG